MPRPGAAGSLEGVARTAISPATVLPVRIAEVQRPAETLLLAEYSNASNIFTGNVNANIDFASDSETYGMGKKLHSGKFNYLFVDGHVQNLKAKDTVGTGSLTTPKGMWTLAADD
jgi:prepilin-type processing-associated H-X9-DG protein